ncbi:MAG: DUF3256 family protein [Pyrinomonadaceae bacterium]|nr:DUF3256 family protein [Pyrinomonadaceae bacterium]
MKKPIFLIILSLAFSFSVFAQPKTVTDYFLAMPDNVYSTTLEGKKVTGKSALTKLRKSMIKIEDIKNGYLKIEGTWEGWAEIALFKKTDGSYIIAQAENGCGPACDGFVKFWIYNAGKWMDVTKAVFTEPTAKSVAKQFNATKAKDDEAADEAEGMSFYYSLPREGRVMRVVCNECSNSGDGEDFTIFKYEWNGSKFVKK